MWTPDVDMNAASDAEIIAAYVAEGTDEETAVAYLGAWRDTDPRFVVD